ncbi:unnamed protein product [Cunninghamella blakesleeana]
MNKIIFIVILLYIFYITETYCQSTLEPRGWQGCSLINTTLHCFGGFTINSTMNYYTPIDDHISLDLSVYTNFTTFNKSDIQWKSLSNKIDNESILPSRGMISAVPIYSENSFLIFGGLSDPTTTSSSSLSNLVAEYKVNEDEWESLDLQESTYTSSSVIINLGNDIFWIWGGRSSSSNLTTNVVNTYDFHSDSWGRSIRSRLPMRSQFTATLAHDGYIYIMGGYYQSNTNKNRDANFQDVLRFNTNTSLWSNITATGNIPTNRIHHTTTEILGTDSLLIYGGINLVSGLPSIDSYYIYNIDHRNFTAVQLETTRYAHSAIAYDSSYLIFNFGYINSSTPADSLNVLNIKDPFKPIWLLDDNINTTVTTDPHDDANDHDQDYNRLKMNSSTVAAIVVPIVVVVVLCIMGSVYYILYKARKSDRKRDSVGFQGLQAELGEIRNSMLMDQTQINELNEKMHLYPQASQIHHDDDPQSSQTHDHPQSYVMDQELQTSSKQNQDEKNQENLINGGDDDDDLQERDRNGKTVK